MECRINSPEGCLSIASDAARGAIDADLLLCERGWRATFLATLLLHWLLLLRHTLWWGTLVHAISVVVRCELALLLVWIVLVRHLELGYDGGWVVN